MAVSWFPNAPPYPGTPNWEISNNSGGSYAPYPGGNVAQILNTPTGTQRFRRIVTVPAADVGKSLQLTLQGDTYDNSINAYAQVYWDGAFLGVINASLATVFNTPALTSGNHTLEIWVGQSSGSAGVTNLGATSANLTTPAPTPDCKCERRAWKPKVADVSSGWTATPQTVHVDTLVAGPTFTINGPVYGVRFRAPDFGGPSVVNADGAINIRVLTNEAGDIVSTGWAPAIPAFPGTAAGPFTKTQNGVFMTLNRDGHLAQANQSVNYRLAKQNANPISPEFEWFSIEFDKPQTNFRFISNSYQASAGFGTSEGISQLEVLVDTPCDCCPLNLRRCYSTEELQVIFNSAAVTSNPQGYVLTGAASLLIDQSVAGSPFFGFNTPATQIPSPGPVVELTFNTPQNRITRVQEYNQGGGDLGDSDGFGRTSFALIDPLGNILYSGVLVCGNGAEPFWTSFPPVDNVKTIRWYNLTKLNPGSTVSPLAREFQAFQSPLRIAEAFKCADGLTHWYDAETGDEVDPVNFTTTQTQTILDIEGNGSTGPTDNDGWIETGTPVGTPQPPNRVLPAPIFNTGTTYSPNNGAVGNWVIAKTVYSAKAGAGSLRIPWGFQINADDLIQGIRVNGVTAPFTYGAVVSASVAPVMWLKGANTVEIEVSNTVAGNTSLQGLLDAITPIDVCYSTQSQPSSSLGPQPLSISNLHMAGAAFNDAPNEFMCNISPAPTTTTGWTATPPCFDPTTGAPSMDWAGPLNSVIMEYGSASGTSGGAGIAFSDPINGLFTWATNTADMVVGEVRTSLLRADGSFAKLTYVSGPPPSPSGTIRMETLFLPGGIDLHRGNTSIVAPIRFRLDFYK